MYSKALFIIIFGILIFIFPKQLRRYRVSNSEKYINSRPFIMSQKISGIVLILIGICMIIFRIE